MRAVREITAEMENFRIETLGGLNVIKRDPVEPEPVGTIILMPMRVMGYDRDCDGSLMARLEMIGLDDCDDAPDPELLACATTGEFQRYGGFTHVGLYPTSGIVVTPEGVAALAASLAPALNLIGMSRGQRKRG